MPLNPCPECGTAVSTTAKACPACGASAKAIARANRPPKKTVGRFGKIAIGFAALAFVAVASFSSLHERPPATPVDAKTDAMFKQRGEAAVEDAVQLKRSVRDPDSLTFDKIRTSNDGSIVCISYRGDWSRHFPKSSCRAPAMSRSFHSTRTNHPPSRPSWTGW